MKEIVSFEVVAMDMKMVKIREEDERGIEFFNFCLNRDEGWGWIEGHFGAFGKNKKSTNSLTKLWTETIQNGGQRYNMLNFEYQS